MKITFDWLKDHLNTSLKEKFLIDQLTNIGLEVESVESLSADNKLFKVAKIIKTEKHPNADRLKVCDVDIGEKDIRKVVCGAKNATAGLITIYAPPGATIPKTKTKLVVAKIRGVTSYGMLCSESELNLSDEREGIVELPKSKYQKSVGKNYFQNNNPNYIDLSVTPNRPDCLGIRGIARDLAASGFGKLKNSKEQKIQSKIKHTLSVKIKKEKGSHFLTFEYDNTELITVEKGSVCVNGISLTVCESKSSTFSVAIIPYTFKNTNLHLLKEHGIVNIEFDILGKYIAKLVK